MSRRNSRSEEARSYRHLYNTGLWQARREEQLDKEPYCKFCKEDGKDRVATIADHIVPHKGDVDLFFKGELQSLCKWHHDTSKQQVETRGYRSGFDNEGYPLDARHPWRQHD